MLIFHLADKQLYNNALQLHFNFESAQKRAFLKLKCSCIMLLLGGHIQVYRLKKLKKLPPPAGTPSIEGEFSDNIKAYFAS